MDRLWTPWRYAYITGQPQRRKGVPDELAGWPGARSADDERCVFCNMLAAVDWAIETGMPQVEAERAALIVGRGETCFVCLNRYPYASGHVMVVPYQHCQSLAELPERTAFELIMLTRKGETAIRQVYRPDGLNMGLNLGEAAGAGVAEHLHLHALPRWAGDTNFMTALAETRILPEELPITWRKLRDALAKIQPALRS